MGNETLIYNLGRIGRVPKFIFKKGPVRVRELMKHILFKFFVIERFLAIDAEYQPTKAGTKNSPGSRRAMLDNSTGQESNPGPFQTRTEKEQKSAEILPIWLIDLTSYSPKHRPSRLVPK
jgi:hypothetical protein